MAEKIPWPRVALEGVVIIASILLAFGIEAAWEQRKESARLQEALLGLEGVLSEQLVLIDQAAEAIEERERGLILLLTANADRPPELAPDALMLLLEGIHRPTVFNLNGEELISLLEAEALQGLDDPALRTATARWRGRWQIVLDRHESLYEHQDAALQALAAHPSTRAAVLSPPRLDGNRSNLAPPLVPLGDDAFEVALRDNVITSLAAVKLSHIRVLAVLYQLQADRTREVLQATQALQAR